MQTLRADYRLEVDQNDVFRAMGYPGAEQVSDPVRDMCLEQLRRLDELLDPWAGTHEVRIEAVDGGSIHLESGRTLNSRRLASILRRATSLQICLATVGSTVTAEIQRLVDTDCMVEALALDAAASAAAKALMAEVRACVCAEATERNCGTTPRYGPGYTGWRIQDGPVLFSYLRARTLPVRLNEQLMMIPTKSLLGVIGIVPGGHSAAREALPCRLCDLERCSVRQVPSEPARNPAPPRERKTP